VHQLGERVKSTSSYYQPRTIDFNSENIYKARVSKLNSNGRASYIKARHSSPEQFESLQEEANA